MGLEKDNYKGYDVSKQYMGLEKDNNKDFVSDL